MARKKLLIENPALIIDKLYYSQKSSTLLVGIIGVFMVFVSFMGNVGAYNVFNNSLKSSLYESNQATVKQQNITSDITIGKQIIIIGGKEYTLEITPKF